MMIGLDWGSTALRAFLIDAGGKVLAERGAPLGASTLSGAAAFSAALAQVCGDWDMGLPMLACGMVGSRHGWLEAPYASCPAGAEQLAALAVRVEGGPCIVPGLLHDAAVPDVMRGEETQILGALQRHPALAEGACVILPGTHSKWATVEDGRITGFGTHMTGELYALLRRQSVLSRLMPEEDAASPEAFIAGVDAARTGGDEGLGHQLFAVRTLGLMERMPVEGLADYLSGLLIGHELRAGLRSRIEGPLAIVGEPALCERYARALARFGESKPLLLANTAPDGLACLARHLELLT